MTSEYSESLYIHLSFLPTQRTQAVFSAPVLPLTGWITLAKPSSRCWGYSSEQDRQAPSSWNLHAQGKQNKINNSLCHANDVIQNLEKNQSKRITQQ